MCFLDKGIAFYERLILPKVNLNRGNLSGENR